MIDLAAFRADPDRFRRAYARRGEKLDIDALVSADAELRAAKLASETKRAEANQAAKTVGETARKGKEAAAELAAAKDRARALSDEAKSLEDQRAALEAALHERVLYWPNPILDVVPDGADPAANVVRGTWGSVPEFAFKPKAHWDLGPALGIIDFERAAKVSGSGFVVLRGSGARLARALLAYFLDTLTTQHGYVEHAVPHLVLPAVMQGTGQLPKFADQLYKAKDDDLYLIPTAEVPLTNLYRDEIIDADRLPLKLCAHTPCYRREAGAAGIGTRGMTRVHQFDKVEMVWLTTLERAEADLLTMRSHAEGMLQALGLHHRVLELCAGDTGFGSAHTYDLEVYSPGTATWLEVSSCSNFTDFQGRRANIRQRAAAGAKPAPLATLNGSGLALPRVFIGIIETYQQADGSIRVPQVLQSYMGGATTLAPSPAIPAAAAKG